MIKSVLPGLLLLTLLASPPASALDLFEAYNLGLANDPKVLAAEATRNAAQKQKPIGLAGLLPSVVLNVNTQGVQADTGKSQYVGQANTAVVFGLAFLDLTVTQPLFRYDAWITYAQADYQLAQAQAQLEYEYQDLAVRVARAYFEVLYGEDIVEFTTIQLKSLDIQTDQVRERLNLGFATLIDLNETQSRRDKIAADLILAEQKLNDAREALREIIGLYEVDIVKVPDYLPLTRPDPEDIEKWNDVAQQGNLNVIAATSASEISRHNIELKYAGHLPTVNLSFQQYTYANNRPTGAYQVDQQAVGINMTLPIYLGGSVTAQVDQARDQYEQSLHLLDQQRRTTQRQVKDAYRGVLTSIGRIGALKTALKSGLSALEGAQMGFKVGHRTVVDVLWQQTLYFQYWADYARARYDYLINGLLLKQAAGTLLQTDIDAINRLIHNASLPARELRGDLPHLIIPKPSFTESPVPSSGSGLHP